MQLLGEQGGNCLPAITYNTLQKYSNFYSIFECHLKARVFSSDKGFSMSWWSLSKAGGPRGAGCTLFLQNTETNEPSGENKGQ